MKKTQKGIATIAVMIVLGVLGYTATVADTVHNNHKPADQRVVIDSMSHK